MGKPRQKWLIIRGTVPAGSVRFPLPVEKLPHPFRPQAFGFYQTARMDGMLFIDNEPFANAEADLAAQFGRDGHLLIVPEQADRIYSAEREFKLEVTNPEQTDEQVHLAILGDYYIGLDEVPAQGGGKLKWLNVTDLIPANQQRHLTADLIFPFMPYGINYFTTGPAEGTLFINSIPLANQDAEFGAIFGHIGGGNGPAVPIPESVRKLFGGKTTFDVLTTDISGDDNKVTVSFIGTEF